jgi:RNA polymerase-binding transcription factor
MTQTNQNPPLPIEELQQRLRDEEQRLQHELYEFTSGDEAVNMADLTIESGGIPGDQVDNAEALSQVERNRAMTAHTQHLLRQVTEALARIDAGTYGKCTNCGRPIQLARLQALPYVALCIDCQAKSELAASQGGLPRA